MACMNAIQGDWEFGRVSGTHLAGVLPNVPEPAPGKRPGSWELAQWD